MKKLEFKLSNTQLDNKEISKINKLFKTYWSIYLFLSLILSILSLNFLNFEQYLTVVTYSFVFQLFIFSLQMIISKDKRNEMIKIFSKLKSFPSMVFASFMTIFLIGLYSFAFPISQISLIMRLFGNITILNKKYENKKEYKLKFNGTEIFKQNGVLHRELELIYGNYYYLPAFIKLNYPMFKTKSSVYSEFFNTFYSDHETYHWCILGDRQPTMENVLIPKENIQTFKDDYNKKRLQVISENF
jgi:amino acid transporter